MLDHRTKHLASLIHVDDGRILTFVGKKELMYGERSVDIRVDCAQGIQGGLQRVEVKSKFLVRRVDLLEVRGLRLPKQGLHVEEANHAPIHREHPVTCGCGCTRGEQAKTDDEQTHCISPRHRAFMVCGRNRGKNLGFNTTLMMPLTFVRQRIVAKAHLDRSY